MERSPNSQSYRGSSSTRESVEEIVIGTPRSREVEEGGVERVYIAVKKEFNEGKSTLLWLLQNIEKEKRKIVVTHVHIPAQMIPMLGTKFPARKLKEQVVKEYGQNERVKMQACVEDNIIVCSNQKVRAEKLVIEADDIAKGLVELISLMRLLSLLWVQQQSISRGTNM